MYEDKNEADSTVSSAPPSLPSSSSRQGVVEAAHRYREKGWVPIPVAAGSKAPTRHRWTDSTLDTPLDEIVEDGNLGVLLGDPSGGLVDVDLDCPEAIVAAQTLLPGTNLKFGRESRIDSHWFYRVPDCGKTRQFRSPDGRMLVEYRAKGAATVVPPSIHPSGEGVTFTWNGEPSVVSRDELMTAVSRVAASALLARHWVKGSRHEAALALSGGLLRAGWTTGEIGTFVSAVCDASGDDQVDDRLRCIDTTLEQLERDQLTTGWPALSKIIGEDIAGQVAEWLSCNRSAPESHSTNDAEHYNVRLTELGNVDRFEKQHRESVAYCGGLSSWLLWRNGKWELDETDRITQLADRTARSIFDEVSSIPNGRERDDLVSWAKKSCTKPTIDHVLGLAKSRLQVPQNQLDTNKYLLNCLNGAIDLTTGKLLQHNRKDWLTMQVPYAYDPASECPAFVTFLDQITNGDEQLSSFMQRAFGYSLTGRGDEQCLFIAHGEGANGKSTLLNLFRELMGDYAKNAPAHTLSPRQSDGAPRGDVVRLQRMRFVTVMESESNQRMSDALIKQITGGDTFTARAMYKEYVDFNLDCKVWLATNHKPKFASDDAIWRRIRLIPFSVVIPPEERDPRLPDKLRSEAEGILAWAVRGCLDWQQQGLRPPAAVLEATNAYREENDDVAQFVSECLVRAEGRTVTKDAMLDAYLQWAQRNGGEKLNKLALGRRLKRIGLEDGKSRERFWTGVRIVNEKWDEPQLEDEPRFEGEMGAWAVGQPNSGNSLENASHGEVSEIGGSICPSVQSI